MFLPPSTFKAESEWVLCAAKMGHETANINLASISRQNSHLEIVARLR